MPKGIKLCIQKRPDVVLLDLGLPDIDGAEVLTRIQEIGQDIPVGIISGYEERKNEILALGAKIFFQKPVLLDEVETWIKAAVKK